MYRALLVQWARSLPPTTAACAAASAALQLALTLRLLRFDQLMFEPRLAVRRLQLWRFATSALLPGNLLNALFALVFLTRASARLERSRHFAPHAGLFLLAMLLTFAAIAAAGVATAPPNGDPYLHAAYRSALLMMESRLEPDALLTVYGLPMPAKYYPLAVLALDVVLGGNPRHSLLGFAVGFALFSQLDALRRATNGALLPLAARAEAALTRALRALGRASDTYVLQSTALDALRRHATAPARFAGRGRVLGKPKAQ